MIDNLGKFKDALDSVFDDVLYYFRYYFRGFPTLHITHKESIITALIKDVDSALVGTEMLQLYVDHIEYLMKHGIRPVEYTIPERIMRINFLRDVQSKIKGIIERKNSARSRILIVDDPLNADTDKQSDFRAFLEHHWQLGLSQWDDSYKELRLGDFVKWIGGGDHDSSDLHSFLGIIEAQLTAPTPFVISIKYALYLEKVISRIRRIRHERSTEIMSPMSVEEFKNGLDKVWDKGNYNPRTVCDFINVIKDKCKDACQLYLFIKNIDDTINEYSNNTAFGISPMYKSFLNNFKSHIEKLVGEYRLAEFKTRDNGLTHKKFENIAFLTECYNVALSELTGISDDVKKYVKAAVMFIANEISDTNRSGIQELMSRIKAVPDYRNNPTYDIAMDIMEEWIKWCGTPWNTPWGIGDGKLDGPEMTKNSIKKALQAFGKPFCCDTGGPSWTVWPPSFTDGTFRFCGEVQRSYARHIASLRDNPNGTLSRNGVSVGSTVKICDGEERFWVKIIKIEGDCYYGRISNNLIGSKGYNHGDIVVFGLKQIWDIEDVAPKPEDIFKPGDRVCFIKQSIYKEAGHRRALNCFLGIVTGWKVSHYVGSESESNARCSVSNVFNVLPMETLSLEVVDKYDVSELIEDEDFSRALVKSDITHIEGNITLCPIDEEHFPKLNEILAKVIAKDGASCGR